MAMLNEKGIALKSRLESAEQAGKLNDKGRAMLERLRQVAPEESPASEPSSVKQTISKVARPVLEVGGAVGGGIIGAGAGAPTIAGVPIGAAAGGALGFAGGKATADILDRALGLKDPIRTLPEAAGETLDDIKQGLLNEAGGKVIGAAGPVAKALGRQAARLGQATTGVEANNFIRLAKDPSAVFAPSLETAGENLGKELSAQGVNTRLAPKDLYDPQLSRARQVARDIMEKARAGKKVDVQEIVDGKKAINRLLKNEKDNMIRREIMLDKNLLDDKLGEMAPELKGAQKAYARSALKDEFMALLPKNKGGSVSKLNTSIGGVMALLGHPLLAAATVPAVAGAATATVGAGAKVAQALLGNPNIRRAILSALEAERENEASR